MGIAPPMKPQHPLFSPPAPQAPRLLAAASLQKRRLFGCSAPLRPNRVHRRCAPHDGLAIAGDRPLATNRRGQTITANGYVTKNDNGSYKGQLKTATTDTRLKFQLLRKSRVGATSNRQICRQSDAGDYIASSCSSSCDLIRLRLAVLFCPFQTGAKSHHA